LAHYQLQWLWEQALKAGWVWELLIIGGLLLSMLLTLFIVPAMYSYLVKDKKTVNEFEQEPIEEIKHI